MPLRDHRQARLIAFGCAVLLAACAGQRPLPPSQAPPDQSQLPETGARPWIETDAVVVIDNQILADHLRSALTRLDPIEGLQIRSIDLIFSGQAIGMALAAGHTSGGGESRDVVLEGEIDLSFNGAGLTWFPVVHRLTPVVGDTGVDESDLARRVNSELARQIVLERSNRLGLGLSPPKSLTLSAGLPGLGNVTASQRFVLPGAFTVAASRMAIGPQSTSIALDLEFVEGISPCAPDVSISRSALAREIVNREPRGIEPRIDAGAAEWHYFTEVSGARRNLTLVHYWFADGRAIGITELPVEPSARWRTWSSLPVSPAIADHIEVFAADRDTGCILDVGQIKTAPAGGGRAEARESFEEISRSFPSAGGRPQPATAELSRSALAEAVNAATADARFAVRMDLGEPQRQPLGGFLDSLAGLDFNCEWRDCSVRTECTVDFSRCQRRQETRECITCLFRNPLNDRCVSERVDADCEALKASLNVRYAEAWEACMAREESAQRVCEERGQEAAEVCERTAQQYQTACAVSREVLGDHEGPVADITGEARTTGGVTLVFSGLQAVGDFERLKGQLFVDPDLALAGGLKVSADEALGALGECIDAWDGGFQVRVDRAQPPRRLAGDVYSTESELTATWPGITVPLSLSRGLLEDILESTPEPVSACSIGLEPGQIGARASGEDGLLLRGLLPLDVQPGAASIALPQVTAQLAQTDFAGRARAGQLHVVYELQESNAPGGGGAEDE